MCQVWLKLVLGKKIFTIHIFLYFLIISPWKGVRPFIWTSLNFRHPRRPCVQFSWNWSSESELEGFKKKFVNIFSFFNYHLPLKRDWSVIWSNLNPHHPRMLRAKFGWYWSSCSGDEKFKISARYFRCFAIISPSKKVTLHMYKL